jgi:hypothetical protein
MRIHERAAQIWPVLALAATNRQQLTYDMLGNLIGVARQGLGQQLEPIQSYCLIHELPALTILVVKKETGLPGTGFTAAAAAEYGQAQQRVYDFDWLKHGCPKPEDFDWAVRERPSNSSP